MKANKEIVFAVILGAAVTLIVIVPFAWAWRAGPPTHDFGGFLFNPTDGNTYLAKMQQGFAGSWRFRLPYTAEAEEGAFLFVFYLALGHLSRILSLPLIWVFHLSRVIASLLMLAALFRFYRSIMPSYRTAIFAFILAALGAGLGWLSIPFGGFTADFWVAEAYPFLSAFANPHFPLSLALTLLILTPGKPLLKHRAEHTLTSLGLALISPFGIIILGGIFGLKWVFQSVRVGAFRLPDPRLFWLLTGGGSVLIYDAFVIQADPLLAGWNAQNITPTPPLGDLLISFSPALPLALIGLFAVIRGVEPGDRHELELAAWLIAVTVMVLLPLNLQRRMLIGLYIPLSGLAALGLAAITRSRPASFRSFGFLILLVSLPTNILVLMAARHGIITRDPGLYLGVEETAAMNWVIQETEPGALILAGPDTGLLIPAHTGRRVIYGHPFETVNAYVEKAAVSTFFEGNWDESTAEQFLIDRGIDYVFWGPRERALGSLPELDVLLPAVDFGAVKLFRVGSDNEG